ncbi:MAG: enoyl-CoA hydratase [Pseudomonadota bacterium]
MIESPTELLTLGFDPDSHCLEITINNPPANTWNAESLTGLVQIVSAAAAEREVWSILITGQGERFFSAGADLKLFADGDKAVAADMSGYFGAAFEALANFRGVTIAAINGYAMGGGLECVLACDIAVAEQHAQLAMPEATVGLLPCGGGTQNLAWAVGEGWAKRMILCGERVDAETALRIGLVHEVVDTGAAIERARALAQSVGKQSPPAVASCKDLIQRARHGDIGSAYTAEREAFVRLFDTRDQQEGVNAFLEKRKAAWVNG